MIYKDKLDNIRQVAITDISNYIKEYGDLITPNYHIFMNPGLNELAVSSIPYVMCDGTTKLLKDMDTDTICYIADYLNLKQTIK